MMDKFAVRVDPSGGSMGQTVVEKIISRKLGGTRVAPGEIVVLSPDVVMAGSNTAAMIIRTFNEIGASDVWDRDRIVVVLDHCAPAESVLTANAHRLLRNFCAAHGIRLYGEQDGICHDLMIENGHVAPGMFAVGQDSHTPMYGGIGAFGFGVDTSEMGFIWAVGKTWVRVPHSMRIHLRGTLAPGVFAKDLSLSIIGRLGSDGCNYRAVEFVGPAVPRLGVSDRLTICNMSVEMGAKATFFPPDDVAEEFARQAGVTPAPWAVPDSNAAYEREAEADLSAIEPTVACPHRVDNVAPARAVVDVPVHQGFIGSCANARIEDLAAAAVILRGRRVNPDTRLLIAPTTRSVFVQAVAHGYITTFLEAGAMVLNPGCGACFGGHQGVLADGEICISSSNRNFRGRLGNAKASVYLASPATVAASCVAGRIADPRDYL